MLFFLCLSVKLLPLATKKIEYENPRIVVFKCTCAIPVFL